MKRLVIPWVAWVLVILATLQAMVLLAMPMVGQWRPEIENLLADRLAAEVSISEIGAKASLSGPYLEALNLIVERPEGRVEVRRVRMVINWLTLITEGQLTLDQLILDDGQWIATGRAGGDFPLPDQWSVWLDRAQGALAPIGAVRINNFDVMLASLSLKRVSVAVMPNQGVLGRARVINESISVPFDFDWRFRESTEGEHDLRIFTEAAIPLPESIVESVRVEARLHGWLKVSDVGTSAIFDASWQGGNALSPIEGTSISTASTQESDGFEMNWISGGSQQPGLSIELAGARATWSPRQWSLVVPELKLEGEHLNTLLSDPDPKLTRLLIKNQPKALLSQISVSRSTDQPLRAQAQIKEASIDASGGIPELGSLRGHLFVEDDRGFFEFTGRNATFSLPEVFPKPWEQQSLAGTMAFRRDESGLYLRGHDLVVSDSSQFVKGDIMLDLSRETEQSLHLELIADAARPALNGLLPIDLDPEVRDFLVTGIEDVAVVGGRISYSGPLGDGVDRTRRELVLDLPMESFQLKPLSDWPGFVGKQGRVTWQNRRARVTLDSANFGGLIASNVQVTQSPADASLLTIEGDLTGDAAAALDILGDAGIRPEMLVSDVQLSGPLSAEVSLQTPIENGSPSGRIDMRAESLQLAVTGLNAPIESIQGEATYVVDEGLLAEKLTGQLLNQPVEIDVRTFGGNLDAEISGLLSTQSVVSLASIPLDDTWLAGDAEWRAQITGSSDGVRALIETQGKGLISQLPAPLTKAADAPGAISIEIEALENDLPVRVDVFDSVEIIGSLEEANSDWLIRAPSVDLLGWAQVSGTDETKESLRVMVDTDQVVIDETPLAVSRLAIVLDQGALDVSFDGEELAGRIQRVGAAPLAVDLERLVLPKAGDLLELPGEDALGEFNPGSLPSAKIAIADLLRGTTRYQDVRATTVQGVDRLDVTRLSFNRDGQVFNGEMAWQWTEEGPKTAIALHAEGAQLGQFLRVNEQEPLLEAKSGTFSADLSWDGSPLGFSILTSEGRIVLSLKNGRFVDLGNSAEVLRLFGILNIETLTRRLRLDFLDLVQPGVAFDEVTAEARVSSGTLTLEPDLEMEGPSASFRLTGETNLVEKRLNHLLEVDIPLTNNLPLASVLLGAPQVGGAIYLVEKALGTKIIKVGKTNYRIEGSFDEPNINLVSPFLGQKESSNVDATTDGQ